MTKSDMMRSAVKNHGVKHIGFKGAKDKVEDEGYSSKDAGAIIASAARKAGAAAKARNPRLSKVKGY